MVERAQTFKTHARFVPAYHFFVLPVLLINLLYAVWQFGLSPAFGAALQAVVSAALVTLALSSRVQALTVQDRVIRLEMRLRLARLLPSELQPRINDLSARQLVALRFASDAELPALVREVLDGRITTSKDIKIRVKDWQADWLRA